MNGKTKNNDENKKFKSQNSTTHNIQKTKKNKNCKFQNIPKSSYNLWTRSVVCIAVAMIVYYITTGKIEKKFAIQSETILERFQVVSCSESYANEIAKFPNCIPNKCGRLVTDNLINNNESNMLLSLARTGFLLSNSSGGVSIMDLHSGAISHETEFINLYNLEEAKQFLTADLLVVYENIKSRIMSTISRRFGIDVDGIFLTKPTFFSQINNQTSKTVHDEYWHSHVDKETYPSFHYTSLLYLSDFGIDFSGGRFVFFDEINKNKTYIIEPKKGRVSIFTSGAENEHYVEKVMFGTRYAITIAFTCDREYAISNPGITTNYDDGNEKTS